MKLFRSSLLLLSFAATVALSFGDSPKVFPLFSDHGILQQDTMVPIWGTATPGEVITVTFHDAKATATADASGKWLARLQTPKAEPGKDDGDDLKISSTSGQTVLHDVVVGEVWIGSGQSNIDTAMSQYVIGRAEALKADIPGLRLYSAGPNGTGISVKGDFAKDQWDRCTPATAAKASAEGFFFSRDLHKALNVPVGFINMAVAGTPLATWVLPEWLDADPRMATNFENFKTTAYPRVIADRKDRMAKWQAATDEAKANGQKLAAPWPPFPEEADQPVEFFIGRHYVTHTAAVMPFVFKGMLWDQGESGVGYSLQGDYDVIFDIMIHNLRKGFGYNLPVIYSQIPKGGGWGPTIHTVTPASVALPDAILLADQPPEPPRAGSVFESFAKESDPFLRMNALPSCFMATTRDLQAALHPPDKDEYGARFCAVALANVYGQNGEWFGPMITSATRADGQIRLDFDHLGGGLTALGGKPLQGFYATAADGKSVWAQGRIEGNQVILSGAGLDVADTVSYANTNGGRVMWANLFNKEGFPAYPMTVKVK